MGNILELVVPQETQLNIAQKIETTGNKVQEQDLSNDHLKHLNAMLIDMLQQTSMENWALYHESVDVYEAHSLFGLLLLVFFVFSGDKDRKTNKALHRTP
jgi:hypothetical protein